MAKNSALSQLIKKQMSLRRVKKGLAVSPSATASQSTKVKKQSSSPKYSPPATAAPPSKATSAVSAAMAKERAVKALSSTKVLTAAKSSPQRRTTFIRRQQHHSYLPSKNLLQQPSNMPRHSSQELGKMLGLANLVLPYGSTPSQCQGAKAQVSPKNKSSDESNLLDRSLWLGKYAPWQIPEVDYTK